jgi:hypothetical protein
MFLIRPQADSVKIITPISTRIIIFLFIPILVLRFMVQPPKNLSSKPNHPKTYDPEPYPQATIDQGQRDSRLKR